MYNVTQILQSCKEKMRGEMPSENQILNHVIHNNDLLSDFCKNVLDADPQVVIDLIHEFTDMRRIMPLGVFTQSEVVRTFGRKFNRAHMKAYYNKALEAEVTTIDRTRLSQIRAAYTSGGKYVIPAENKPGDATPAYIVYSPCTELTVTPHGLLVIMLSSAVDHRSRYGEPGMAICYRFAYALYLATLGCTTHTVCPAGFPITAVQEEAQESPVPVAEESKVSGTPKSEPATKHDDSNVIINMTPDLLTMMIKTAVNESVNAVWQKFMENREILMNT